MSGRLAPNRLCRPERMGEVSAAKPVRPASNDFGGMRDEVSS